RVPGLVGGASTRITRSARDFFDDAQAGLHSAGNSSHLRVGGGSFTREEERLFEGRRESLRQIETVHWDVTIRAADICIGAPVMKFKREQFILDCLSFTRKNS